MKKCFLVIVAFVCIFSLTGCDQNVFDVVENFLKENNSGVESTEARSVEGHVKNIEYAIMQAELKGVGDSTYGYHKSGELINILGKQSIYLPKNDYIKCVDYTIAKAKVTKATGCANMGDANTNKWNGRTYTYDGAKAYLEDND